MDKEPIKINKNWDAFKKSARTYLYSLSSAFASNDIPKVSVIYFLNKPIMSEDDQNIVLAYFIPKANEKDDVIKKGASVVGACGVIRVENFKHHVTAWIESVEKAEEWELKKEKHGDATVLSEPKVSVPENKNRYLPLSS